MRELLQIGEVARLIGVSTKTIRYYHEIGLLDEPERASSGYRLYTARHLLRLQRIRRLRALGLSLEKIRAILGDAADDGTGTLRAALLSLVGELSAQILELEGRRELLQALLAGENLEPVEEGAHLFYTPALKTQFASLFAGPDSEAMIWGERIDAMLGSFRWPAEYRQAFQATIQHVADQAERYSRLFTLEERFAALADLPADAPEVAQLAEDYASSPELQRLFEQIAQSGGWEQDPHSTMLVDLLSTVISPAQRRLFELLAQKQTGKPSAFPADAPPAQE
jgi:DNA-binding transcriptional MerR regulator